MDYSFLSGGVSVHQPSLQGPYEPRKAGRFAEKPSLRLARAGFGVLCRVAPGPAARLAYALLAKPPRAPERRWQTVLCEQAQTTRIRHGAGELAVYEWGNGPTVLMVHGWGARATHMGKLIEPLVRAGFRVVSFDRPSHGDSTGRATDLMDFASAVDTVARHAGPVHTLLAHSFGVAMALYARRDWGVDVGKHVLISSFDHCKWFTNEFAQYVGVTAQVMERARRMMEDRYSGRLDWDHLSVIEMVRRTHEPTLIMHDTEDAEIPFQHSLSLAQAAPHARFHTTSGWGHHRLLGSPTVIEHVVRFVSESEDVLQPG